MTHKTHFAKRESKLKDSLFFFGKPFTIDFCLIKSLVRGAHLRRKLDDKSSRVRTIDRWWLGGCYVAKIVYSIAFLIATISSIRAFWGQIAKQWCSSIFEESSKWAWRWTYGGRRLGGYFFVLSPFTFDYGYIQSLVKGLHLQGKNAQSDIIIFWRWSVWRKRLFVSRWIND